MKSPCMNIRTAETEMQSFQAAITDMRVRSAKKIVSDSAASISEYKMLTLNIVTSCKDRYSQNKMVDMIEAWSLSLDRCEWHKELIEFCRERDDIVKAVSTKNNGQTEFIIIMDDSSTDTVLDYNGFAFELRRKYDEIYDFMVLDVNTSKGIEQMFEDINVLYERGNQDGDGTGTQE